MLNEVSPPRSPDSKSSSSSTPSPEPVGSEQPHGDAVAGAKVSAKKHAPKTASPEAPRPVKNAKKAKTSPKAPGKAKKAFFKAPGPAKKICKKKKRVEHSFKMGIYNVLKTVHPTLSISNKSMQVMESMMMDMFTKLAAASQELVLKNRKKTMTSRDVQGAVKLVYGHKELAKHAVQEGIKAMTRFTFQ